MSKIIVSLSGGMDSATVLALAIDQGMNPLAVGFKYGSKHNAYEIEKARELADHYKVPFKLIDVTEVFKGFKSNLMEEGGEIPEGHYQQENMKLTVVPGRNLIFISILAGLAESVEADDVWLGAHSGDHVIYPDCRPAFLGSANSTVYLGSDKKVQVHAPFMTMNKIGILERGMQLKVPYHLTRTCYKAQPIACGKCGSCQERLEAFKTLNIVDPVEYA